METDKITTLLQQYSSGNINALNKLIPFVYSDMHKVAFQKLQQERRNHPLNATALVHETYLRLLDFKRIDWQSRDHFFRIVSRIMRNILVDYAVKQKAQKRGGGIKHVPFGDSDAFTELRVHDNITIRHALEQLEAIDKRQVHVIECRFFGGLTIEETAAALDVSPATVSRDWQLAKIWLNRVLTDF